jgi:hypothetical protein
MEDKKVYTIIGKVEIGTDEYRDLIEQVAESKRDADKWNDKYYTEHWELERVKKELTNALTKLSSYNDFFNSSEEMKTKYKLFLAEKQLKEQSDDDE